MSGRDYEFLESALRWERTVGSEDLSGGLQGKSEEPHPTEPTDDDEARNDFASAQGHFIYRHHNEPRVPLHVPKAREETFPIPLKYIDATRSIHTNLEVMQAKRMDDHWNVDENRSLSGSWTGFTKFTLLKEEPPKGKMWSGWRLTKVQTTTRPDHVWPEVWTQITKAAQKREKQEWANEKPKIDNARRMRGIYFNDPEDEEFKETIKKCEEKVGSADGSGNAV